ncbi:MAG: LacI family transcriptional regulator [Clostridiales bacterium]|jgi:LacI family repressor for deo operon, udp, cdd, tsx, nupC, and nupG|nr:LacI family transcriptional regulator [Clostridiales bacterium]
MCTILDVAREAGVSVASVSRVINGSGPVSVKTTAKVKQAIKKLNYQPNIWGRRLRRKESRMLLVLVPNIHNPFYASIVSGIEDSAKLGGYGIMLCITNRNKDKEYEFLKLLKSGQADGAVMMTLEKQEKRLFRDLFGATSLPPVVQCCEYCDSKELPFVAIDNLAAAKQAVEYLISIGHRRIGFIGSVNRFISSELRLQGYRGALTAAGLEVSPEYEVYADEDYGFRSGMLAAKELLGRQGRPSAIFCISDVLALGAIRAAREVGIVPGRGLSVLGFDDVESATMFHPLLTTVSQPRYEMGRVSADMLIRMLENGDGASRVYLEHQIILRESTAANR